MKTKEELNTLKEKAEFERAMLSDEDLSLVNGAGEIGNGKVNPHSGSAAAGTGNGNKCYVR